MGWSYLRLQALLVVTIFSTSFCFTENDKDISQLKTNDTHSVTTPNDESDFFVEKFLKKYGENGVINFEGFEHLLENLGLANIYFGDHKTVDHWKDDEFVEIHPHHNHTKPESLPDDHDDEHDDDHHDDEHDDHEPESTNRPKRNVIEEPQSEMTEKLVRSLLVNVHNRHLIRRERSLEASDAIHGSHDECLSAVEILDAFDINPKDGISKSKFIQIMPAILYQLDIYSCRIDGRKDNTSLPDSIAWSISDIPAKVWGYSTAAVVVISLVGLLGVAIIPVMQKVFYNHLLQFLVALAVGALSGDALLHLLPHALIASDNGKSSGHNNHSLDGVWKGLSALMGIFFFFVMERVLTIITDLKRKRQKKKSLSNFNIRNPLVDNHESVIAVGAKLSKDTENQSCEQMLMVVHPNKALKEFADDSHHDQLLGRREEERNHNDEEAEIDVNNGHHGHSHHHGDKVPSSVAAIAWMVILGDGIHNFSDGLAIGAAFVSSVTGGFSTSIAVFCHELPHEIGDFAVLIRAGMSAKQAIIYNCLSSVLCFIGMLAGVALGNIQSANTWIFASVAGIFLYIALVDMLPEMTSVETKKDESAYCHLLLQCLGMMLGAGIMLIIAVYEDDLKSSLEP